MLMNLFSMFDMSAYTVMPVWAVVVLTVWIFKNKNYYSLCNSNGVVASQVLNVVYKEMKQDMEKLGVKKLAFHAKTAPKIKNLGVSKIFSCLLVMVFVINFLSLFPMVFSPTSHISVSLPLSLAMWLCAVAIGVEVSTLFFSAHFTPLGTPLALMSFMVCIETVSTLIRPLTLAVRLTANLVAGHLLLFLLSKLSFLLEETLFWLVTPLMLVLGSLELMVSIIQGYVITLLVVLYFKESF